MIRHELVASLVRFYLERAGYTGRVRVFTRSASFERHAKTRHQTLDESDRSGFAVTIHGRIPMIWVNPEKHTTISQLADTAAHEAAHIVLGLDFPHGRSFDRRVRRLLRGGVL